jgi:ABC-type transport system involved in multi-copper enzyme maturation permease subunit
MIGRRISLVALHVFKESVRDRVLYAIAGFALLLVSASAVIGQITAGQDVKIMKDLGRRSIYSLLAKPLARWEFIVGKYLGLVLTITVNVALMTAALFLMMAWMQASSPESVRLSWDAPAVDPRLLVAIVLITAELALLTAIALFFSTFSSSALLSIVFTVGFFVVGLESKDLRNFDQIVASSPVVIWVVTAIGWLVPAFSEFDKKAEIVHGFSVPMQFVVLRILYAAIYSSVAVGAAVWSFSRREFK